MQSLPWDVQHKNRLPSGVRWILALLCSSMSASAFAGCTVGEETCSEQPQGVHTKGLLQLQFSQSVSGHQQANQTWHAYVPGEPGAAWSEWEALVVMGKLRRVFDAPQTIYRELKQKYGEIDCHTGFADTGGDAERCDGKNGRARASPGTESLPNAAKFIRLGFHDCIKYTDGTGGCDGCLRFYDMFHKYNDLASGDKRQMRRPDPVKGTNNGLYLTADVLDEIYTNANFPTKTHKLQPSLQERGKSRADLWAFAAMVATDFAMLQNNNGCDHNEPCNHLYNELKIDCMIRPARNLVFKTGRADCAEDTKPTPNSNGYVKTQPFELNNGHRFRNYETTKDEDQPNPSGNGSMITDYMKRVFGFSKKETVAIMGAHSLGELHGMNSLWKYSWQWQQTKFLNNNYYRMLVSKPSYFLHCAGTQKPFRSAGGPNHEPAQTGWFVRPIRKTVSAGPYEWFHYYNRCPLCYKDSDDNWISDEARGNADYKTTDCCKCNEQAPEEVDPKCWGPDQRVTKDEVMLPSDMALYVDFDVDPETGFPSGCPGMAPATSWNVANVVDRAKNGRTDGNRFVDFYATEPLCPVTQLNDGPNTWKMGKLVERYADDQDKWVADFYDAWEKMLSNGNTNLVDGPDVLGVGRAVCEMRVRKMTCSL